MGSITQEMIEVFKFTLRMLKGGREVVNDDSGESELVLTSGDEWVSCILKIERILEDDEYKKVFGE